MSHVSAHTGLAAFWHRECRLLFALSLFVGLILGVISASSASDSVILLMRLAISRPVSIVGLLSIYLLPFVSSILAVFLSKSWMLLPICFLKALIFGFCARVITVLAGDPDWLLHILFLFSDTCSFVMLCWFWIRHISGRKVTVIQDAAICIVVFIILGTLDYCYISPFLAMLIKN